MGEIVIDIETVGDIRSYDKLKVSIACIYDYGADQFLAFREADINKLWPYLEKADRVIGYNSSHFDLPILNYSYSGDLTKIPQLDILEEVKRSLGFRLKLDDLAQATLKVGKSGHGLQTQEWYRNGEFDKIEKYCLDDVKITRDIYEYGKKNKQLFYSELATGKLRPFPVNFAMPESLTGITAQKINLTLPF